MKRILFFTGFLSFLLSCTNQENSSIPNAVIDVESSVQNLTKLKMSDFGKTIRYIPLETADNGLVGNSPVVKVLRNHIVIEFERPKSCLLFDKKDGRFIASIGHTGQDPEAFSSTFSWTDEKEEFLYFGRQPNQLIKYDMKGNFCGKVSFPGGIASCYLLTDSEMIGYYNGFNQSDPCVLRFFDREGVLLDSIPPLFPKTPVIADGIAGISVIRGSNAYGNWARAGAVIINYKNDNRQVLAANAARLWRNNGNIRFKEDFVDTIYTFSDRKLIPSIIFNTGKYSWPVQEATSKNNTNERIFIADVSENDAFIFFQCIKGMYSDEPVLYNGLHHKKTGGTKLGKHSEAIEDDLTRFMPFTPLAMSTSGEFVSILETGDIMEWMEKHPEARNNEKLPFLKELDAEMNPVIVLVE